MLQKFYDEKLKADYETTDLRLFNWQIIKNQKIKIVFLDIDNTLVKHGSREPDEYAKQVIQVLRKHKFDICILSNAMSDRITEFADNLGVDYLENARKPSAKRLLEKLEKKGYTNQEAILVGDQLFTDIWAGKNAGCLTLLVQQRFHDEAFQVKLKRHLEKYLIRKYQK